MVEAKLRGDVTSGAMFLFVNRRRTMAKVLWVDGVGTCLFAKRLEKGRFASLWACGSDGAPNAHLEAVNAKIQKLKKRACGYRNRARFRDAILFHCGGLDLYPQLATAHTKS